MAYMSSSAPLPQNSLMPPPAAKVAASNARIARDFLASRTGRERVYSTLPTAASFWGMGPGLAVDANQMIGQSETARQSVLIGLGLPANLEEPTLDQITTAAPTVVSLNAPDTTGGIDQSQTGLMPAAAPSQTYGGLWASPKNADRGRGQRAVVSVVTRQGRDVRSGPLNLNAVGPGCPALSVRMAPQPLPAMPSPPSAPNPPSPASMPQLRPPTYANICWALKNGVVLQSQLDPIVNYTCTQLGYFEGSSCPPPPNTQQFLNQNPSWNRQHINVSAADLAAIPPAPSVNSCQSSYALGGMSGVSLDWGDAGMQQTGCCGGAVSGPVLLGLGIAAVAALLIFDRKRRGR